MEHMSHCEQAFTINHVTIIPWWQMSFEVRMFTACFCNLPDTFREIMGVQITVSSMCELLASLIHQNIFKAMEHRSYCAQVFTINHVTISPRWRTAFEVRMFTACFCNLPVNFAKLWASQLQLEVCVNYWIRASIEGSFFVDKSVYLIVGILIVMDLAGW